MVAKFKRDRFTVITVRRNILPLLDRLKEGVESRCDVIERLATKAIKSKFQLEESKVTLGLLEGIRSSVAIAVPIKIRPKVSFSLE